MSSSLLRHPAARLLANGQAVPGLVAAELRSVGHFAADRFSAQLAVSPAGQAWWAAQSDVVVDLQFSLDGATASLAQGLVDTVRIDPLTGLLHLDGRSLVAAFIETRTQESFTNHTSSEIAQILAARHGLSASVVPTTTPVGRYYQIQHDSITLDQFTRATTEWDLLVTLAQTEGYDVFVTGTTLHFQPAMQDEDPPVPLTPADVTALEFERALTLARDIEVTVKSWNSRQGRAFTQTARSQRGASGAAANGGPGRVPVQRYVYVRPNMTPAAALQFAQSTLAELSRHERSFTATMPGDLALTPRSRIQLTGTGTGFDQLYYIAEVTRSLRIDGGFVQHIRARNMSTAADATVPADPPAP